jgi:hypothetical protein
VIVIDDFLPNAEEVAAEFPSFESDVWHEYNNPIEIKKTCNNWNHFGPETYRTFTKLLSPEFAQQFGDVRPDFGLHGGGLHSHARGGKLNVHLDYDIHPKLELQRYLNLIVYLTPGWKPEWGGELGFWDDPETFTESVWCKFNRAVIFETKGQWHGLPNPLTCPEGITRNSIAVYYLVEPDGNLDRKRALFLPTQDQKGDPEIAELIRKRADNNLARSVYR